MTKPKPKQRRIELNAGQAIRLQSAEADAAMLRAQLEQASRVVQREMQAILGVLEPGEMRNDYMLEIDGDKVELVEVLPDLG